MRKRNQKRLYGEEIEPNYEALQKIAKRQSMEIDIAREIKRHKKRMKKLRKIA